MYTVGTEDISGMVPALYSSTGTGSVDKMYRGSRVHWHCARSESWQNPHTKCMRDPSPMYFVWEPFRVDENPHTKCVCHVFCMESWQESWQTGLAPLIEPSPTSFSVFFFPVAPFLFFFCPPPPTPPLIAAALRFRFPMASLRRIRSTRYPGNLYSEKKKKKKYS